MYDLNNFCDRIKTRNPEINKIKNNNNMQYVLFFTNNIQLLTVDDFNKIFKIYIHYYIL